MVQLQEYQQHLAALPYGKRLPTAVYVYREPDSDYGPELNQVVAKLAIRHELGPDFNVIKFRTDELKVSFLSYPDFLTNAHPALRHAVTIDLVTGRMRRTDYAENLNPPILHRKETFVPAAHPSRGKFEALTMAEEAAGLYAHTATIGFKLNWDRLLEDKGLVIRGHKLHRKETGARQESPPEPLIERHKTALTRYE